MPSAPVPPCGVDPFELLLTRILRRAVASAVLTSVAGLSPGCDDGSKLEPIGEAIECPASGSGFVPQASGLHPRESFDYVSIRSAQDYGGPPSTSADANTPWGPGMFDLLSETGRPCASAATTACTEKLAQHPVEIVCSYAVDHCIERSVVTTRGDEVKRWSTQAELVELLAPIDTPDEAMLLVSTTGPSLSIVCDDPTLSSVNVVSDGYEVYAQLFVDTCPVQVARARLHVSTDGKVVKLGQRKLPADDSGLCVGRIPAGLSSTSRAQHANALGDFLASCAHLEAASVYAFARMVDELRAYGAPEALIAEARAARDDEVRHARVVAALARARGGEPTPVEIGALPLRSLEAIAIENATEGCVRETYGALLGAYQAEHAGDLGLRRAMGPIARDEARHAALSQRVHAWALSRLDPRERERVRKAQREAVQALAAACDREAVDDDLVTSAGLPPRAVARSLVRELSRTVWRDALA